MEGEVDTNWRECGGGEGGEIARIGDVGDEGWDNGGEIGFIPVDDVEIGAGTDEVIFVAPTGFNAGLAFSEFGGEMLAASSGLLLSPMTFLFINSKIPMLSPEDVGVFPASASSLVGFIISCAARMTVSIGNLGM